MANPEPRDQTTGHKVAVIVTVHCTTNAQVARASELLTLAVSGLALDGIDARMRVKPHESSHAQPWTRRPDQTIPNE